MNEKEKEIATTNTGMYVCCCWSISINIDFHSSINFFLGSTLRGLRGRCYKKSRSMHPLMRVLIILILFAIAITIRLNGKLQPISLQLPMHPMISISVLVTIDNSVAMLLL